MTKKNWLRHLAVSVKFAKCEIGCSTELPICNSERCKVKFSGHWLRYSTCTRPLYRKFTSNKKIAFIYLFIFFLLQTYPYHCLFSYSDHRTILSPIFQLLHLITNNYFAKNKQIGHTRSNMTRDWL